MSYAQRRLWFLDQLEPGSSVYTIPKALRLTGPVDTAALGAALAAIVDRHESLRTTFRDIDGTPSQVVSSVGYAPLKVTDLSTGSDPEGTARAMAVKEASAPFDLAVGPLFRAHLLILGGDTSILVVTMSHIVSDGWSMGVLISEAAALYPALAAGQKPDLPELEIQYPDYSVWQRELEGSAAEAAQIEYWKQLLAGAPQSVDLPFDRPRPAVKTSHGAMTAFTLPSALVARLKTVCNDRSATLFMGLLAGFGWLMSRYGNQADIPVATLSANRNRKELEPLIGFFVNTLPLRLSIDETRSFGTLLDQARTVAMGAYDHQDVPFDRLVETLNPERDPGSMPLVNVMMTLQNAVGNRLELPGIRVEQAELFETRTARFDIELYLEEREGAVAGECVFNTDLFDEGTIARMMEGFVTLIEAGVTAPDAPLSAHSALPAHLRQTMIESWNQTDAAIPDVDGVIRLFERRADANPDAPALLCGTTSLTYGETNRRANRLARRLAAHGAGPGSVVAVQAARSPETVIGLLAVLKTGAAYAPVDPSYPAARRELILADCGARLLLTDRPTEGFDGVVIDLADPGTGDGTNLSPAGGADDIAYLIYTSGSTGRPKGVQVSRRSHLNYIVWAGRTYAPEGGLVFPLFTSLAFDLTVTSIFVPLTTGGAVAIYPERPGPADAALLDMLADNRADIIKLTPAHLAMLAAAGAGSLRARRMILGGEELKTDVAGAVVSQSGGRIEIFNEYGPTETTVGCMIHRFDPATDTGTAVPIGKPAPNVKLYILDDRGNPVPPGVIGELFVAGVQVAAGYRNRPEDTADRFLPDPFHPGLTMYKTGDRAVWRADGVMEFRGRNDDQVKIQGYRVELGEVETAMKALDGIGDCVVIPLAYDAARRAAAMTYCARCGLPSVYPGAAFDGDGVCIYCRQFDLYRERGMTYFKTVDRFLERFPNRGSGTYDCLALFSGGKDSTYMLCRLVEMGLRVFAFTFDNGYLYEGARENIRRTVSVLGIDHAFGTIPNCREILADSLSRYSNVCNSCFKAVLTCGMREARRRGIDRIVTGLSRGQLFETRLAELFNEGVFDEEAIETAVKKARAVYHRMDDAVTRSVRDGLFDDDSIFNDIEFVDFYRYTDVTREEIFDYLTRHGAWVNPTSIAGCTTNCLVNDVGIWVHTRERGYNNYALPNSWEVRLGHKDRQVSIDELNAPLDEERVATILSELGCKTTADGDRWRYLAAYYTGRAPLDPGDVIRRLSLTLPPYMLPSSLVHLDRLPLSPNGKVDKRALASIGGDVIPDNVPYVAPRTPVEEGLAGLWQDALGLERIGTDDNLFQLGGHSLMATRIIARAREMFGVDLPLVAVFENPTVGKLARVIERSRQAAQPALEPRRPGDTAPLSFSQNRLWLIDRIEGSTAGYVIRMALRITGAIDTQALASSLNAVIDRHEVLRTTFDDAGGQPRQIIAKTLVIGLPVVDLRQLPPQGREVRLTALLDEEQRRPFDLKTGPLIRATLYRTRDDEQVLQIVVHHIVFDGWSAGILIGELIRLYAEKTGGPPAALPPLPVQYADYAAWERKTLDGERLAGLIAGWKKLLEGAPATLDLPTDKPRPPVFTNEGAFHFFDDGAALKRNIDALARRENASPFMIAMAAFVAVLGRFAGQEDVVVGFPIAHRMRPEVAPLIGFFANTLMIRGDLSGDPDFGELTDRVRKGALAAYDLQELPFEKLVEEMHVSRSLSHTPVFQVMLAWDTPAGDDAALPGLRVERAEIPALTSHFDLTLVMNQLPDRIEALFEYNTSIFISSTIHHFARTLSRLLAAAVARPAAKVAELLQPEPSEGPAAAAPRPAPAGSLCRILTERAAATPDAVAVRYDGEQLTYAALDQRSNRLAAFLAGRGVRPRATVGVLLPRGLDFAVAMAGILKAGSAYLPIDPAYPDNRIYQMLSISGAAHLITTGDMAAGRAFPDGLGIIRLDYERETLAALPATFDAEIAENDPAYVLFTSGSTGEPKGVLMPHGPLVNLAAWQGRQPGFSHPAVTAQFAAVTFDVHAQEYWATFATGGTVVIVPDEIRRDMGRLLAFIDDERIERLFLPYVALNQMAETAAQAGRHPASLREVVTAGERLVITPAIRAWFTRLPSARLHNQYGPTESHVVTSFTLPQSPSEWPDAPSIGRPIDNAAIRIADAAGRAIPPGAIGEIFIGGAVLATGYIHDPARTAERFVTIDGARHYRTSDRARLLPDGSIEYRGRNDHQVKIRGYRIEPGEIEAVLSGHPDVGDAAVVVRRSANGALSLAAFATPTGSGTDAGRLREYLRQRLPDYMVPSRIAMLDAMPLTSSGKIDRLALARRAEEASADTVAAAEESCRPVADLLRDIWGEILEAPHIGLDDNFFDSGGHSLLATRLVVRINQTFGTGLTVREVFERQTVRAMAERLEEEIRQGSDPLPPLGRSADTGPLPLSYAQERLWVDSCIDGPSAKYNMAAALVLEGELDRVALERALEELMRRHEPLRSHFATGEEGPYTVIDAPAPCDLTPLALDHLRDEERDAALRRLIDEESSTPFDLAAGPLFRARLARLGERKHLLTLTMSHIISDGWSLGVVARELSMLYNLHATGTGEAPAPLPVRYGDYARWQRKVLSGDRLGRIIRHWAERLSGAPPFLNLPAATPLGATPSEGGVAFTTLDAGFMRQIADLARSNGATTYMILFSAYAALLARMCGQEDIVIGVPVANRTVREVEPLIGFFVNVLPVRIDLSGDPAFSDIAARARDALIDAYAHQEAPLDLIVRELNPPRAPGRHPLFQAAFTLQSQRQDPLDLAGLQVTKLNSDRVVPKYDLLMAFSPDPAGLGGLVEYKKGMFSDEAAGALFTCYLSILRQACAEPRIRLLDLDLGGTRSASPKEQPADVGDFDF